jgi:hypothetical protein
MSNKYACYVNGLFYDIVDIEDIGSQIKKFIISHDGESYDFSIQKVSVVDEAEADALRFLLKEGFKYSKAIEFIETCKDIVKASKE